MMESILRRVIGRGRSLDILDVGCGTGINLGLFAKFGRVCGVDASPEAVRYCHTRGFDAVREGRAENLSFADKSFDMVAAIELLEHIRDDVGTLREFSRVLRDNGFLFLTVPAYQFLWTEHDEALDHVRRYTLSGLKRKLETLGFVLEKGSYMVTFTSPLFLYRILKKIFARKNAQSKASYVTLPRFLNDLLVLPFFLEAKILNRTRLPFGISIICVARKVPPLRLQGERSSIENVCRKTP